MNESEAATNPTGRDGSATARRDDAPSAARPSTSKKSGKERSPPQLTGKYASLSTVVAPQRINLQWTMFNKTKNMLDLREQLQAKVDGIARFSGNYLDKHDVDADGRPKEKPFVPGSLRMDTPLNTSELVRTDGRLTDIKAEIDRELARGRSTLDEMKDKLTVHAKKIAELELRARQKLLAAEYYNTLKEVSGALAITARGTAGFEKPTSTVENLAYAAASSARRLFDEDHLRDLPFVNRESNLFDDSEALWDDFQKWHDIDYDNVIKPQVSTADHALVAHVATELAKIIPALTTSIWSSRKEVKEAAAIDADLDMWIGRKAIDDANDRLSATMDVDDGDKIRELVGEAVDERLRKKGAREKQQRRKKSSGDGKTQTSKPTKSGQRGRAKTKGKDSSNRGRSQKRSAEHSDSEGSYDSEDRQRSKSRQRNQPRPILKKKEVRWKRDLTPDDRQKTRNNRNDSNGNRKGSKGRGRGDRGGRGGSRKGDKERR